MLDFEKDAEALQLKDEDIKGVSALAKKLKNCKPRSMNWTQLLKKEEIN